MKSSQFLTMSLLTAVLFFSSCNGTEEKANTDKTGSDSTNPAVTAEAPTPSTIVTTPQEMLVVRHKVSNFTKWKASYESHDSMRLASGLHNYVIGRGVEDSNMVLVAVKADDMAKAKAFAKNPSLKQAMQKGGVTGTPSFLFTTATFQDTATIGSYIRSLTTFAVKDWAAWQKGFAEGSQERTDNGLVLRVLGHDAVDSNKVVLVMAVMDTAKAFAYFKSDMLKKRRAASGVIGTPGRFLFHVVQRY